MYKTLSRIASSQTLRALGREAEALLIYDDKLETAHLLPMTTITKVK